MHETQFRALQQTLLLICNMKLTDKDAASIAHFIRADTLKNICGMNPDGTKDGVHRYDTPAGTFFLPVNGTCRENKALDALYKIAATVKKSILDTAFELMDYGSMEFYDD